MEMIQKRQAFDTKQEHHDLFNNLLCANDQDAEITLDSDELLGVLISEATRERSACAYGLAFGHERLLARVSKRSVW